MRPELTVENGVVHGDEPSNYLSEEEHLEQRIKWTQREIAAMQQKKKTEKEEKTLSNGRKRYFNEEISRLRKKLRELIKEADK